MTGEIMTMDLFTDLAVRAAGVASAVLGWRPAEFWGATPAELLVSLDLARDERGQGVGPDDLAALKERFPDG